MYNSCGVKINSIGSFARQSRSWLGIHNKYILTILISKDLSYSCCFKGYILIISYIWPVYDDLMMVSICLRSKLFTLSRGKSVFLCPWIKPWQNIYQFKKESQAAAWACVLPKGRI